VSRPRGDERGIALVASAFVLVVVAALVAGIFFAALQEYRMGRNTVRERRAFEAAEAGLARAPQDLGAAGLDTLAVGDSMAFSGSLTGGTGRYVGVVQRLNPQLLLFRSTGSDGSGSSERVLAMLARFAPLPVEVPAALVTAGPVEIGPSGSVDGAGVAPEGWDCPAPQEPAPGIEMADSGLLRVVDCASGDCVRGNPSVREDTLIRGSSVPVLGEGGWARLLRLADTIPSGTWTPSESSDSFPVRYAPGDLVLDGVQAQGVLLAQGDLSLEGGALFVGVVVARGHLSIRGVGGRILGAAVAASADVGTTPGGGSAAVVYSGCVVRRVVAATARPHPLTERAWAAIF
jgi:hypothetical protein